jgi:hypothetical protein
MNDGIYKYEPSATTTTEVSEEFDFVIVDNDGDMASRTLTITVVHAAGIQVVRDVYVITNQDPTEIPDWALLANDEPSTVNSRAIISV